MVTLKTKNREIIENEVKFKYQMEKNKTTKELGKGRMCLHCLHRNTREIKPGVWKCYDCETEFCDTVKFKKERDERKYGK